MEHLKKWLRCTDNLSTPPPPLLARSQPCRDGLEGTQKVHWQWHVQTYHDMTDAMYEMIQTVTNITLPATVCIKCHNAGSSHGILKRVSKIGH